MVHHNNAIKLHEIQQKVIEDHVNFQYFHFYIESVSTGFPRRTAWIYFHGWNWVQSDQKERARMEQDWPTGHCCMVAVSRYVLPSLIMRFSTMMPAWHRITPESMRCCGRARTGGASYVCHCVGFSQRCPGVVQHLLGIHQCLLSTVHTFPESDGPTPGKISCGPKSWPVMTLVWRHAKPGSGTSGFFCPLGL